MLIFNRLNGKSVLTITLHAYIFEGEGIIGYGHTVYTILHPKFPLQRAGIVSGMQVLNFKSDRKLAQDDVDIHRE